MAPPYINEDVNISLVQQGLDAAEDEIRDAAIDAYEVSALESDEPSESLDDIDYAENEEISAPPEISAMHEE